MHEISRTLVARMQRLTPLCVGLLAIGCGGGSPSNSNSPAQTSQVGPIAVTFTGHPQAVVSGSSAQITTIGQSGASYSTLSINPAHSLNSTVIAFARNLSGQGDEIFTIPSNGTGDVTSFLHSGNSLAPSFSQSGVVCLLLATGSSVSMETCLGDGSQLKSVLSGVNAIPTISPSGTLIVYPSPEGLFTMPSGGGTATQITTGIIVDNRPVAWSPSSLQIAFSGINASTGTSNVYTVASTGGTPTDVTPTTQQTGSMVVTSWSPDVSTLACMFKPSGATNTSVVEISPTPGLFSTLSPTNFSDSLPTFSPDGSQIAFYRSNAGGATAGIYTSTNFGTSPQLFLADPLSSGATGALDQLVWSPFQASKNFVGAGGTITASPISGFLASQNGSQFASLLTFTATTPSTATLTASATNTSGAPMAFTLGADSITNVSYANVYSGAHSSIPLTATPTVVVTIDAITGFVDYVVPAVAGKAHPMVARSSGNALTYTGQFSAIYDGTGKNLAPGGAASVVFDRGTGKLVSFR